MVWKSLTTSARHILPTRAGECKRGRLPRPGVEPRAARRVSTRRRNQTWLAPLDGAGGASHVGRGA
ncbi:MAG: hypothetical protein LC746_11600 [Acidobacteria bacterium]|nr:hypothetical protein [Acidobacteriota bacterium]